MAKRKRQPGDGPKLRPIKDYHDDEYVPYIFKTETGIQEAWAIEPDLRDGDVRQALRSLMKTMQRTGQLPPTLTGSEAKSTPTLLEWCILSHLSEAFESHGPLTVEDTIGVLGVVNGSVGAMNLGMMGQNYLNYAKGFVGRLGFSVQQLSEDEAEELGLSLSSDLDDDDDSIEGDYHEIKPA